MRTGVFPLFFAARGRGSFFTSALLLARTERVVEDRSDNTYMKELLERWINIMLMRDDDDDDDAAI